MFTLQEQNKQLRSGNDALLCELRVAEADFRIQQNMINEVFYLTEDRLKSLGVDINALEPSLPAEFSSREVLSTRNTSNEERSAISQHSREESQPAAPIVSRTSTSTAPIIVTETKRNQSSVSNGKSCLKASSSAAASTTAPSLQVAPETKKEPLTPEQVKARANALRRSQLKKPVCWPFQEGKIQKRILSQCNIYYLFGTCLGKCTSGAQCRESHDTVPFEFCRAYNDTGVCPNRDERCPRYCGRKHLLFDYEQSMKDACEPLKHRQIDAASAEQGILLCTTSLLIK